jgi:hypothetical protein
MDAQATEFLFLALPKKPLHPLSIAMGAHLFKKHNIAIYFELVPAASV